MRVAAIVLAAGEGRRMGGPKALLQLRDGTFLEATARIFARADVAALIVVLGAEAGRIAATARLPLATTVVVNDRHAEGMLTSVWAGLDAAEAAGADAVLLHPVDNPVVSEATVTAVLQGMARGAIIAIPSNAGRRGHPAGFAHHAWPALRAAPLDGGARTVLTARPEWIVHVPAGADCLVDIDTPEALEALRRERDAAG
jgi:CTP:molybdopterin cytidylyltransferase MocA